MQHLPAAISVIRTTDRAAIQLAVNGMKLGSGGFINISCDNDYVLQSLNDLLMLQENKTRQPGRKQLDSQYNFQHIIGEASKMLAILETIGRVAQTNAAVLIMGESGTGHDMIA